MSAFREERNRRALERLRRAMPETFPGAVLAHALARPFIPPTPRLAVESYWRLHPVRADRLARALARRSGQPEGWTWQLGAEGRGRVATFRTPPAPFREERFSRGPGHCCICGQSVFRLGWHVDLWGEGQPNRKAGWHAACVAAWRFWCEPSDQVQMLKKRQGRRCPADGKRLLRRAEVDHRVPLFRVWLERRDEPWPDLLGYWGVPNLQVLNRESHVAKSAAEAGSRAGRREDAQLGLESVG